MYRISLASAATLVVLAATVAAQPRWGRELPPDTGACFYEDADYQGRRFCLRPGERVGALPAAMTDRISSVRLFGGAETTIFRDSDQRGRSARFITDARDLRREGWSDRIASLEVVTNYAAHDGYYGRPRGGIRGRWRPDELPTWDKVAPIPREGVCFYEKPKFEGRYFCAPRGATYTSLPGEFDDKDKRVEEIKDEQEREKDWRRKDREQANEQKEEKKKGKPPLKIRSIKIFGTDLRVFQSRNFHGRSTVIRADVPRLSDVWSEPISSLRVF